MNKRHRKLANAFYGYNKKSSLNITNILLILIFIICCILLYNLC